MGGRALHAAEGLAAAVFLATVLALAGCQKPPGLAASPVLEGSSVLFRYYAPGARVVQVVGSWETNFELRGRDWTTASIVGRMEDPDRDGVWETRVPLGPGRYEYLFRIDGRALHTDPRNPQRIPDGSGGERSLLVVP